MTLSLVAYELASDLGFQIVPGSPIGTHPWMGDAANQAARRCLPMMVANQAGWLVLNNRSVRMFWTGESDASAVTVEATDGLPDIPEPITGPDNENPRYPLLVRSRVGNGIVSWNPPYVVRTSPGYNLLVRGPANAPKDGIASLEGIVETDWSPTPFTVNWKITRPNVWIEFAVGDPVCMLVPQRRRELESFSPEIRDIHSNSELTKSYLAWSEARVRNLQTGNQGLYYMHGKMPDGTTNAEHQTRISLRPFSQL